MRYLCVYCGSRLGRDPAFRNTAKEFGRAIATAGVRLVYGGGGSGLMGIIANEVKLAGGHVTGIIPTALLETEKVLDVIDKCYVVNSYHERKSLMCNLADGFAAFPGGPGTLEELAEQLALAELGVHDKPIYLVNINRYWDSYLAALDAMYTEQFATLKLARPYTMVESSHELLRLFLAECAKD